MADQPQTASLPIFKKRPKTTFKRKHSSEDEEETPPHLSVAEILKQRRQGKVRRSAITAPQERIDETSVQQEVGPVLSEFDRITNRFVPQTGQVVGTYDRQMDEYVEAKMAEFRGTLSTSHSEHASVAANESRNTAAHLADRHSATAGKLVEVDLGEGQSTHQVKEVRGERKPRTRIGRDGKPYIPRRRNRRNSDDLARDALVDSIMKEAPLSLFGEYSKRPGQTDVKDSNKNEVFDEEEVLESFKSHYHAQPENNNRPMRKPAPTIVGGKVEERKGPKMGGSKNARMKAMAEEREAAMSGGKKT